MRRRTRSLFTVLPLALAVVTGTAQAGTITLDIMDRPVEVHIPDCYDPTGDPVPLVMALHGFGGSGTGITNYFQLLSVAEEYCFVYIAPEGLSDGAGTQSWNANDVCCDGTGGDPDDSGYLRAVIEATQDLINIDPQRIYVTGFSNGGHMAFTMAHDHADLVAAILSLAGGISPNPPTTLPSEPVHILHVMGTEDPCFPGTCPWPGPVETVQTWVDYNGCTTFPTSPPPIDLACSPLNPDTTVTRYAGCDPGGSAELWIIEGAPHNPCFLPEWPSHIMDYFYDHPKPPPPPLFQRGDCNGDGVINPLADAFFLLEFGFLGGPAPGCDDAADVDDDSVVNPLQDGMVLLLYGFAGGSAPPAPFLACGADETGDALGCVSSACP